MPQLIALDTPDALKRSAVSPEQPDPTMETLHSPGGSRQTVSWRPPYERPTMHKDGEWPLQTDLRRFDLRRLIALVTKESYQALRDPRRC